MTHTQNRAQNPYRTLEKPSRRLSRYAHDESP